MLRLLVAGHRPRFTSSRVEQPGFLRDRAARLENIDLPARLVFNSLCDETHGVDVLDLAASAERRSGPAHRHVHVSAHRSFLHVAVAGSEIAQDRTQLLHERGRLLARAHVWPGDDLHERDARPVEIDVGMIRPLVVQAFTGVLLEMQPFDTDPDRLPSRLVEKHFALAHDRVLVLRNLIAGRQVGIKIVFPVEQRAVIDLRLQTKAGADRLLDTITIDDRQHARHCRID